MVTSQNARRQELYGLLGDLPERHRPIGAEQVAEERRRGFVVEKLVLDLNGREPVPAYFVRPEGATGRLPVVLYNHAHGGDYVLGKDELLDGRSALQRPPYADALTSRGYAALCIDTWLFGERRGRTEAEVFKQMLWQGQVLWGMMVYDSLRAIDYLQTRDDVDPDRIATLGLSMGSTMAWWLAALDERVKVTIDLCCLTDYQALLDTRGLDGHGIYYYVPRLLRHFDTAGINALIAPRPHLSLAGDYAASRRLPGWSASMPPCAPPMPRPVRPRLGSSGAIPAVTWRRRRCAPRCWRSWQDGSKGSVRRGAGVRQAQPAQSTSTTVWSNLECRPIIQN